MRRLLMLVALGGLVLPLPACSDDEGNDNDNAGDDPTSVITRDKTTQEQLVPKTTKCDAEVRTTGGHETDWQGEAQVRTGGHGVDATGPSAVYMLTDDEDNRVALFSPGKEFTGSISVSIDGVSYANDPADAESFDIDEGGRYASVDTTLTSVAGDELGLVAEFACGKDDKK